STSKCYDLATTPSIDVPFSKIPLEVRFYPDLLSCANPASPNYNYRFPNGIDQGGPLFDSMIATSTTPKTLVLPTSITRRGKSPFMSIIPQVMCGSGNDCIPQVADL